MKKELPPFAIWALVGVGVLALVGAFMMAGDTNRVTEEDRQRWEMEAEASAGRNQSLVEGRSAGAPVGQQGQPSQPGQGSAEYEARMKASQNSGQ